MTTIGDMQDQSTLINGWELLGEAYDVASGEFARPSGVQNKTNLFDFSSAEVTYKKVNDANAVGVPEYVSETELNEGFADDETAEEASDYGVSYDAKLKMNYTKGTFNGDFSAEYSSDYAESEYYWCSHLRAHIKYYQLVLDRGNDEVPGKSYLTAQAREDLNGTVGEDGTRIYSLSPQQLVAKYGTHYMSGVVMGGIWIYSRAYSKFKSDSKSSANAEATASSTTWHSSGKLSVDESKAVESTYNEARTYQNGGDPTTLANSGSFDAWKTTVSMANSVLVDFTDESLIPISDLIDDEARRQAVLTQITQVLDNAQLAQASLAVDNSAGIWLRDGELEDNDSEMSLRVDSESEKNWVLIGLGVSVNGDGNVYKILGRFRDLDTLGTYYLCVGDGADTDPSHYEKYLEIDLEDYSSYAIVGVGGSTQSNNTSALGIWYQRMGVDPEDATAMVEDFKFSTKDADEQSDLEAQCNSSGDANSQSAAIGFGFRSGNNTMEHAYICLAPMSKVSA